MKKSGFIIMALVFVALFGAIYFLTGPASEDPKPTDPLSVGGAENAGKGTGTSIEMVKTPDFAVPKGIERPPTRGATKDDWEAEISEALANDQISNEDAVLRLLSLAYDPKVDEEVRLEALEHGLNLTDDENFQQLMPLFKDKSTPVDMLDSVLTDLYNRGDRVKLEAVLAVAQISDHPMQEGAMELLEFYIDEEDYGDDWNAWGAAVQVYLDDNEIE